MSSPTLADAAAPTVMSSSQLRARLVTAVQLAFAIGIMTFLIVQAQRHERFHELLSGHKNWLALLVAAVTILSAVLLSYLRWWLLVRAQGLVFSLRDAMRLGSIGYLMNFLSLGSVGGDVVKAVLVAKEQPERRPEAVATVVVDRVIGLGALLLVTTAAFLIARAAGRVTDEQLILLGNTAVVLTALSFAGFAVLWFPFSTGPVVTKLATRLPLIGPASARLLTSVDVYRGHVGGLLAAFLAGVTVHLLVACGIYLIVRGLPGNSPTLGEHFIVGPMSMVAAAIPLTPNGLGTFEAALDYLYQVAATDVDVAEGRGTIVALCFRLITIIVAAIGAVFYLAERRAIERALARERERLSIHGESQTS